MLALAQTDKGRVRTTNQDTVYCSSKQVGKLPNLFVVADGMGGASAGDYASSCLVQELVRLIQADKEDNINVVMRHAIDNTNLKLYMDSVSDPALTGMGSTLVTAVFDLDGATLYATNVGDSRMYCIGRSIRQITRDHSYVAEMVKAGVLNDTSEEYREKKNLITRAVGVASSVNPDFFEVCLHPDEMFLMCTDGLTNMLSDDDIFRIVKSGPDIYTAVQNLIDEANAHGGRDNISVILIAPYECEVRG
jgi:PPM family protein phosphatase